MKSTVLGKLPIWNPKDPNPDQTVGFGSISSRKAGSGSLPKGSGSATMLYTVFFFPIYFHRFLCICTSAAPQRPAHRTVSSQVATHLRTDRVFRVLGRSWIWTQDYWFAVRCATIEPPLLLLEPPLLLQCSTLLLSSRHSWILAWKIPGEAGPLACKAKNVSTRLLTLVSKQVPRALAAMLK
jgi:hypothetical protein